MNYDELAKQFGGSADQQGIDYDALAMQHGASIQGKKEKPARTRLQATGDEFAGMVRGAGSIGASLMFPKDYLEDFFQEYLTKKPVDVSRNEQRRSDMTSALELMGADTDSNAFKFWKFGGEVAGTAGIPVARGGKYAVDVAKNVLGGGAAAALIDPTDAGVGASIGGTMTAVGRPLAALYNSPLGAPIRGIANAGYHVVEPWLKGGIQQVEGRTLRALAGDKADRVAEELAKNRSFVAGSYPIAGEAAVEAGSTGFAAGQEALKKRFSTAEYLAREKFQEAGRKDAIKIVGPSIGAGDDNIALNAAETIRKSAAAQNYGKAFKDTIKSDQALEELMSRPAMKAAVARAKEIADNKNQLFSIGENRATKVVPGKLVRDENNVPSISQVIVPGDVRRYPVQSLHTIKKALDDVINSPERFVGVGEIERGAALSTRSDFLKWLTQRSKPYEFAKQEHARLSGPINQMEVAGYLENKLTSSIGSKERPALFAQAIKDAPSTIKSATGIPRADDLSQYLGQMGTANTNNVMSDLIRQAEYKRQAQAGGGEAARIIKEEFKPKEPPGMLHRGVMIARSVLERMQGKASEATLKQLAADMLDPVKAAQLMRLVPEKERFALDAWARAVNNARNPIIAATASD